MTITLTELAEFLDTSPRLGIAMRIQYKFGRWHVTLTGPGLEVINAGDTLEDAVLAAMKLYTTKRETDQ